MAKLEKFAIVILVILIITAFVLRNKGFHQPHLLTFDEDVYVYMGLQLKENPLDYDPEPVKRQIQSQLPPGYSMPAYLDEPLFKQPPLFPWLISLSYFFKLRPFPYMSAIMVPMLAGVLIIALAFFFGKMLYDYRVGLLAAFYLTIDPIHWLCSEKIWMETTLALFIFLALFLFFRGFSQTRFLLFSGLFAGLALLTKYAGIVAPMFIFLFALVYKKELLFKRNFWLIFIIALVIFSPWLIWNYTVYGSSFFKHIFAVSEALARVQKYKTLMLLLSTTCASLLMLRLFTPRFTPAIREKIASFLKITKFLLPGAIIIGFTVLFFGYPLFRQSLKNMWIYNYLPSTGWEVSMFYRRHLYVHFYFTRLLELSPIYFFAFAAAILLSLKNGQKDLLLILSAFSILVFFVLWENYQSRYILSCALILLILASRFQIWLWDRLNAQAQTLKIKVSKFIFLGIAGYFIIKTINVGIHLALPNNVNYF